MAMPSARPSEKMLLRVEVVSNQLFTIGVPDVRPQRNGNCAMTVTVEQSKLRRS
jgi:hypothetical protein